ncbi:MAG: precorrin-6y C5,15-methyltransferase (decarboxylating) subunit CbiE [Deltaproteobacteria bacterium]|nr:precorrin-6y C5,15-methyltransferase (decarboxylating) subunit CbiE [Deltaproteobacteria bacterium]
MIHVIGIGIDGKKSLTGRPLEIISKAGLLIGGRRHLEEFSHIKAEKLAIGKSLEDVSEAIKAHAAISKKGVAVLATGDPLLFGIASYIIKKFGKKGVEVIPNVSTVQEAFALIKENCNDLKILSGHGRKNIEDLSKEIRKHQKVALFTDPENTPSKIARALIDLGSPDYNAFVCEALGTKQEKVIKGSLESIAKKKAFSPLNILILIREEKSLVEGKKFGIPDSEFAHSANMITKEEIRVVSLSKLDLKNDSVIWDIGACSGSVSIEAARLSSEGFVYAIEKEKKRIKDILRNKKKFNIRNMEVIEGNAPACLKALPDPSAVFVGGGGKGIAEILRFVSERLISGGSIVINAVTIETAHSVFEFLKEKGWKRELVLMNLSKAKSLGDLNLLNAHNPVFIISGRNP